MSKVKQIVCFVLVGLLVLGLCGCQGAEPAEEQAWREPAAATAPEFVDTDGEFDYKSTAFTLTKEHVIITPAGDEIAQKAAKLLQSYCSSALKLDLSIKPDSASQQDKEVLIGKTNRAESNKDLATADLEVSIKGDKLIFDGGHSVTASSAVNKFVRLAPKAGEAFTFKVTTDFEATKLGEYEFVWGDEFEGPDIDLTKWDFEARMAGTASMELSWEKDTIEVADGRLKLRAIRCYDPHNEAVQFKVPYSTLTKYKMNYLYGYAEIRARLPFAVGVWPSFWGLSSSIDENGNFDSSIPNIWDYGVEIDIFEVFGHPSEVVPCIHKWYKDANFNYNEIYGIEGDSSHTSLGGKETGEILHWDFATKPGTDLKNLSNEYHLYGFEWTDKALNMYVDGQKYTSYDITKSYDLYDDMSHFHDPIYLMFNNHLFPDDATYKPSPIRGNYQNLPGEYFIDWIRLYQKPGVGKLYIDETPRQYEGR